MVNANVLHLLALIPTTQLETEIHLKQIDAFFRIRQSNFQGSF